MFLSWLTLKHLNFGIIYIFLPKDCYSLIWKFFLAINEWIYEGFKESAWLSFIFFLILIILFFNLKWLYLLTN